MLKQDIREELLSLNMRATVPRVAILEIFRDEQRRKTDKAKLSGERPQAVHFSTDEMFKLLIGRKIDVGLATVYRVMQQFEEAGVLSSSRFDAERVTYELNEGRPHDHIVCSVCGRVDEFYDKAMIARQKAVADDLGYMLQNHQLALYGICSVCQSKMGAATVKGKTVKAPGGRPT
ncbi:Fur family transcriptional regulator, ferric uptake regulator [Pollutimonas bauzanensis]|uniref:Ferric uptake regulation protein n=2 Tax=Pollutimonas bauzanensis TaxID=658167 RepID=A0A1M5W0G5_9BURK|nr:Fur family transcriptional regulator, ferric uptake regulator [Pollutimonas bauzanensis]